MAKELTVIFDLDGTLTDSRAGILNCLRKALEANAIEWKDPLDSFIGPPIEEWAKVLIPDRDEGAHAQLVRDFRACYDRKGWSENAVYPGIPELLAALEQHGTRLYVCTSKPQHFAERILMKFGLARYFTVICGDRQQLESHGKKNLLAGLIREQRLDTSTTWMVGDTRFDIEAAHANNIQAIAVTYGYGTVDELAAVHPNALCNTPAEILKLVVVDPRATD